LFLYYSEYVKKKRRHSNLIIRYLIVIFTVSLLAAIVYPTIISLKHPRCANSRSCQESLKFAVKKDAIAIFNNQRLAAPNIALTEKDTRPVVLGTDTNDEEKHIYVDLTSQTLYAFEGKELFMQTLISSGKWFPTPTGDFTIWVKLRSTRMSGGTGDDYYNLPNVPYVMFFYNQEVSKSTGFSLHGTYWHNNFGHPMSHGCVNMKTSDVAKLYDWANPVSDGLTTYSSDKNLGTKVTIYGEAPL